MAKWSGFTYYEQAPASPDESWATDASRVMRTLLFPISPDVRDRQLIAQTWLGYSTYVAVTKKYVSRITPHFYPSTGGTYLYASAIVHSEMLGSPNFSTVPNMAPGDRLAKYPWWRAVVQYSSLPWDVRENAEVLGTSSSRLYVGPAESYPDEGDKLRTGWANTRYISKHPDQGGRVIPLRQGVLRYEGTTTPTFEPFPYNEPYGSVQYTWHQVPVAAYPAATIQSYLGTVNESAFDGHATGTLMFTSVKAVPRRDPFGNRTLDITYRFVNCPRVNRATNTPYGHNAILRVTTDGGVDYEYVTTLRDGSSDLTKRPFRYKPLQDLFTPDQ